MQEDIEHRAVTLAMNVSKMTGQHLRNALAKLLLSEKQASAAQASEATGKTVGEKTHRAEPRCDPRRLVPR